MTLSILHEDDELLVIDKPSGLLVHRGIGRAEEVLVDYVRDYLDDTPRPVHRLDRGTSGVILFAKSREAAARLQADFQEGRVTKQYLALVRGVAPESGEIDNPVPRTEKGERVPAQSSFERIEIFEAEPRHLSLVRVQPHTGRFHQIRRHLKHIDHPLIGDANYGKGKLNRAIRERYGLSRLALHAERLIVPGADGPLEFASAMPDDFAGPLARMRR